MLCACRHGCSSSTTSAPSGRPREVCSSAVGTGSWGRPATGQRRWIWGPACYPTPCYSTSDWGEDGRVRRRPGAGARVPGRGGPAGLLRRPWHRATSWRRRARAGSCSSQSSQSPISRRSGAPARGALLVGTRCLPTSPHPHDAGRGSSADAMRPVSPRDDGWSALFATAFKQSRNAMALIDGQRRHVDVNGAYVQLLGYAKSALIGRPIHRFVAGGPQISAAGVGARARQGKLRRHHRRRPRRRQHRGGVMGGERRDRHRAPARPVRGAEQLAPRTAGSDRRACAARGLAAVMATGRDRPARGARAHGARDRRGAAARA